MMATIANQVANQWQVLRLRLSSGIVGRCGQIRFSQEGEDGILARLFEHQATGFYVDVGAHHARRFSNTAMLYFAGWRGINIEPDPVLANELKRARPGDTTVHSAVGDAEGEATYYRFNEPALNTLDRERVARLLRLRSYKLVGEIAVTVRRLDHLLDAHLRPDQIIDVMNVDVEGYDMAALRSLDWARYKPRVVLAESAMLTIAQALSGDMNRFLTSKNYTLIAKTINSLVFIRNEQMKSFGYSVVSEC